MPAADARKLAADWSSPADGLEEFGAPTDQEVCVVFSDDILLLLSLASDDLNERVKRYRAELAPSPEMLDAVEWNERRTTIRDALRKEGKLPPDT